MNTSSNQLGFATLTQAYTAIRLASGLPAGTISAVCAGNTNASVVTDILFRNTDATNARAIDIYLGPSGTVQNKIVQIIIPANAGNNGSTALASLAALAPQLFDIDLAGNRVITLENGVTIYVMNDAALMADMYVMAKIRSF